MTDGSSLMAYRLETELLEPNYLVRSRSLPVPELQAQSDPDRHEHFGRTVLDRRVLLGGGEDQGICWGEGERVRPFFLDFSGGGAGKTAGGNPKKGDTH